jgi:hypothetical protein
MNKIIVTLLAIMVIIGAVFTAFIIVSPKDKKEVPNIETKIAEEEILDECTDEYEGMELENTIKANTEQEKTSPNCSLTIKTHFIECGHTKSEYANLPQNLVNLSKEQIQEEYPEAEVESFASNEVILHQEKEGSCGEHYMVKDKEGQVTIYQILQNGEQEEVEVTGITTEYLPETDKINMEKGIQVNGKQELNQLIEDFE